MAEPNKARVLISTDSYGGFLSAPEACARIAKGLADQGFSTREHPMSDGGEGMLEAMQSHRELELHGVPLPGPLGAKTFATAGRDDGVWVIESAQAIGLHLCANDLRPGRASTDGFGQLMSDLARRAPGPMLVGLGGSATVDGGLGMAAAMGLTPLDADGRALPSPWGATALTRVRRLVGPQPLVDRVIHVLSDTRTPLAEAAAVFGPQKGVTESDIAPLTKALLAWSDVVNRWRQTQGLTAISADISCGGAAGGLGFAIHGLLNGALLPGAHRFARMTGLGRALDKADAVIIGEGHLDQTSFQGKVAETVTRTARQAGVPVLALVGTATNTPAAPIGPDVIVEANTSDDRDKAFDAAIAGLADALKEALR